MVARRYEFYIYVQVARTTSHSFAGLTHETLFFGHKNIKFMIIFELTCNVLFIILVVIKDYESAFDAVTLIQIP